MNTSQRAQSGWRWKPVELGILAIAFVVHWVLGLAVIAWKYWNERQNAPLDVEAGFRDAATRLRQGFDQIFGNRTVTPADNLASTGNAAFDAHVRETMERIDLERRKLAEEIRAFRAFVAEERSGDDDLYRRFKMQRGL